MRRYVRFMNVHRVTNIEDLLGQVAGCIEAGQLSKAEQLCLSAAKAAPFSIPVQHALGVVYAHQRKYADAVRRFDHVLAAESKFAPAFLNRGNVLKIMGYTERALDDFNRALSLRPDYSAALCNRAMLFLENGHLDDAMADYQAVIATQADNVTALIGQGNVLRQLAERRSDGERAFLIERALDSYRSAIRAAPEAAQAHYSLAITLHRLDRLREAIEHYRLALQLQPGLAEAHSDMGVAEFEAGDFERAAESLNKALAIEPGKEKFLWNKSLYLLAMGEFAEGLQLYESRLPNKDARRHSSGWLDHEDIAGKTVDIWAEQGLGDTIQFSRYVPLLQARGARVTLRVRESLVRLLSQLGGDITVTSSAQQEHEADYTIPLLSLPLAFGTRFNSIPAAVPYLYAEARKVQDWQARLGVQGFKIGVAWQGTAATKLSAARSFPLSCLERLGQLPGVRLINLQKESNHLPTQGTALEALGPEFDAGVDAFIDAAAVIQNLDLVITSDTAIAHLAGALGREVWVALKRVPDWRWLLDRHDSPWYPTMTLFRQKVQGGWDLPFEAMEYELKKRIRGIEWAASGKS